VSNQLTKAKNDLKELFLETFLEPVTKFQALPAHGSNRKYFRMTSLHHKIIGAYNSDLAENHAFIAFSHHFKQKKLSVPHVYAESAEKGIYLQEDLGDQTLFDVLVRSKKAGEPFSTEVRDLYRKIISLLPKFQIEGGQDLDYSLSYPHHSFDKRSMLWDMNYFKYYFLKLAYIPFNEQKLEDDFSVFANFLLEAGQEHFLYRDFQSRNIMIVEGQPVFIDFQGGRKGAVHYDVASLLFDAKADIPHEFRLELIDLYVKSLSVYEKTDIEKFKNTLFGFVLVRIMQAMGAYGYRGFYEKKRHFLQSIPYAVHNLEFLLKIVDLPIEVPELLKVFKAIIMSSKLREYGNAELPLHVRVSSFSFKKGVPVDEKGHGGGFVFDCRFLPNPGRDIAYKHLNGNDDEVITFLENESTVREFLDQTIKMVTSATESYKRQNFTDLMISFGCTGGQHRSVYFANQIAHYLSEDSGIEVSLEHLERENWPKK
jgi:aminoglycoside/choline kinase family phosphotransferase